MGCYIPVLFLSQVSCPESRSTVLCQETSALSSTMNFLIIILLALPLIFLLRGILSTIAAVLLHFGNKNGNKGALKAFYFFGGITYSFFDCCAGGIPLVKRRIAEIEQDENAKV